ncbi:MAG: type II secretion system protein GspJ [Bdellovibrionota bacterium]
MMKNPKGGFTIIELLLVSVLLFMLAYSTFMSIRSTMGVKRSIDSRTEILQSGRALLELIDRDLRMAYFVDAADLGWYSTPLDNEKAGGGDEASESDSNPDSKAVPPPKPIPVTLFQATRNELLFSSRSHQRMSADSPEDDQHLVRYRVEQGKLIREESFRAISKDDITDEKQFRQTTLVDNLKSIDFTFWNARSQRWEDRWDTNSSENLDTLPEAVKVKVKYTPEALDESQDATKEVEYETAVRIVQTIFKRGPVKSP